jgi:hypothetical protein
MNSLRPHLTLPLGVEESKLRVFLDYTFGNQWFDGRPLAAEEVTDTLVLLGPEDLQASLDAAQAYHHVGVDEASQTYFRFRMGRIVVRVHVLGIRLVFGAMDVSQCDGTGGTLPTP